MRDDDDADVRHRALARGVTWATPTVVVSTVAPVFGATGPTSQSTTTTPPATNPTRSGTAGGGGVPCSTYVVDWDGGTFHRSQNTQTLATATAVAKSASTGDQMKVTFTHTVVGATKLDPAYNFSVSGAGVGGFSSGLLHLRTLLPTTGGIDNRSVLTMTFPTSVRDVGFSITDIDSGNSTTTKTFRDRVGFPSTTPTVKSWAADVEGAGTLSSPFQGKTTSKDVVSTSGTANVRLVLPDQTSSVAMYFWSGATGTQIHQDIWISDISFSTC